MFNNASPLDEEYSTATKCHSFSVITDEDLQGDD